VTLTLAAIALFTPHIPRESGTVRPGWWPNWHSRLTWSMGLTLGCASIAYFGSNAFIPDFLRATHRAALITPALTALNLGQLPASIVVALMPERIVGHRWPLLSAGLLTVCMVLLFNLPGSWIIVWAALVGLASALTFVIMLALAPMVARDDEVHRLSAAMFTISYACPLIGSLVGGAIWDASGIPFAAFFPVVAAGGCEILLSSSVRLPHKDP
jgi:MFS transporter, CP family, cyanate transporter